MAQSLDSGTMTEEVPLGADLPVKPPTGGARFGALSHHSFFSRHNPHPHRVTHIQGLNGRPVCSVRDDWYVTSSLFPHPLLKSHGVRKGDHPPRPGFPLPHSGDGRSRLAVFSEAWRDELKDLAAKVTLSSQERAASKEEQPEEEFVRRKTQYSAATGRIIPPSSKSYQRRSHSQSLLYPQPLHDQELMVLELLCQILQTDSLSSVQQWLLLACQREKELVMGMIGQALDGVDHRPQSIHHLQALRACASAPNQPWGGPRGASSTRGDPASGHDRPERIGDAEVLEVHAGAEDRPPGLSSDL